MTMPRLPLRALSATVLAVGAGLVLAAQAPAATPAQLKGISVSAIGTDPTALAQSLTKVKSEGATFVRAGLGWADVEPDAAGERPTDILARMDRFFADARARKLKVLLLVSGTPCWASAAPADLRGDCSTAQQRDAARAYPPSDPEEFARFSAFVTQRYAADLVAYEVWNEPDQSNELYFAGPDKPKRYAAMLRAAYPAVKAVAPKVPVLAGALVGSNGAFLKALYDNGIKGYYDGLSVHFYDLVLYSLKQIRQFQVANGDTKPVWLAETGWSSCAPKQIQDGQVCVNRTIQAANLADLYQSVRSTSWLRATTIFSISDTPQYDLGLFDRQGHAKPSATALRRAWASRKRTLRAITLRLRSSGGRLLATGSGSAGDVYTLDASVGGRLRYRVNFRMNSVNTYSLKLPSVVGTRGVTVRVHRMWDGRSVTRSTR
jgi:hypothetical protein